MRKNEPVTDRLSRAPKYLRPDSGCSNYQGRAWDEMQDR